MNTFKQIILAIVCIALPFLPTSTFANPNTAKIWYFGNNAGIDFSSGSPEILLNGSMTSFINVSTMADENGQLLYYTNGGSFPTAGGIWNRNHQLMPNGMLNGSGGCNSALQGVVTVRKPRSQNIYYMFTTDCLENNFAAGLRYSKIDMNLDGGLGDVVQKNIPLVGKANEGVTAVQHINGEDYWIVTHINGTDSFYVFHLTQYGISGVVKNKVGPVNTHHAGAIKASTNGQRLYHGGLHYAALYDFDNNTGQISNYRHLGIKGYDGEFSADCRYLYVTGSNTTSQLPKQIWQFDMLHHDIASTGKLIGSTTQFSFGNIQLGPDEKIYVTKLLSSQSLAVINYPNMPAGEVDFQHNGLHLGGRLARGGLPNFANNVLGECAPYKEEGSQNNHNVYQIEPTLYIQHQTQKMLFVGAESLQGLDNVTLMVREYGTDEWFTVKGYGNQIKIDNLYPDTEYEIILSAYAQNGVTYQRLFEHSSYYQEKESITGRTLNAFSFNLYPNPAYAYSNIDFVAEGIAGRLNLTIFDLSGKLITQIRRENIELDFEKITLNLSDIANGVYFVRIEADEFSHTERLVILN